MFNPKLFSPRLIVALVGCLILLSGSALARAFDFRLDPRRLARSSTGTEVCNVQELAIFGIRSGPKIPENDICPAVKRSCCSSSDLNELVSRHQSAEARQYNYYSLYLALHRYILGLGHVYSEVANNVFNWSKSEKFRLMGFKTATTRASEFTRPTPQPSSDYTIRFHKTCETAAYKFLSLHFRHRKFAEEFYEALVKRSEYLMRARRGMFCSLCSQGFHMYFNFASEPRSLKANYSHKFCQEIFDWTYHTVSQTYVHFSVYLRYLLQMLACVVPTEVDGGRPPGSPTKIFKPFSLKVDLQKKCPLGSLPEAVRRVIELPLPIKREFYFRGCANSVSPNKVSNKKCFPFCHHFSPFVAGDVIDGDIKSFYRVYIQLKEFEFVQPFLRATTFADRLDVLKQSIEGNFTMIEQNSVFVTGVNKNRVYFSIHPTFLRENEGDGLDPLEISKGSKLALRSLGVGVLSAVVGIVFLAWGTFN
jgi:hypothetical protein